MNNKSDKRNRVPHTPDHNSQMELLLAQPRELVAAKVIQFPKERVTIGTYDSAKRRLLEFAARLPD